MRMPAYRILGNADAGIQDSGNARASSARARTQKLDNSIKQMQYCTLHTCWPHSPADRASDSCTRASSSNLQIAIFFLEKRSDSAQKHDKISARKPKPTVAIQGAIFCKAVIDDMQENAKGGENAVAEGRYPSLLSSALNIAMNIKG